MDKIARLLDTSSINRVTGALALLAAILLLFPTPPFLGLAAYLPLHTAMEALTIMAAMLVFATGINSYLHKTPFNLMLLSCAFLAVGLLDFGHTLSYAGMPDFVTPSGAEKAIYFWLTARLTAAAALLAAALLPWRHGVGNPVRAVCLTVTLAFIAAVYWLILFHQDSLPRVFSAETGLTPFKRGFEYLIVGFHAATAAFFYRQRSTSQPYDANLLFAAACIMGLGELFFATYSSITDLHNLFGHLYKTIAYFLIYRAIFVYTVHLPHHERRNAEERLERVLEGSADGFWDCDLRSGAVEYSGRWAEMLGYRLGEIDPHSDSWKKRIHPEDRDRVLKAENDYVEGRAPAYDTEFRMQAKSGEWRHTRSRGKITGRDANGRALRISGAHTDVTAHRRAEEALQASEERYRLIVESMTEGVWVTDNRNTTIFANQRMAEMLGCTVKEMSGRHMFGFMADEERRLAAGHLERLRQGIAERLEFKFRRTDGSELWATVSTNPLIGEGNDFIGVLSVVSDISERKLAEQEISRLEQRNALILQAAGKGICGLDTEGRVTFINQMGAKLLGYTVEELLGHSLHALSHNRKADGSPYPEEECPIQASVRRGVSHFERDELFWHKAGFSFPVEYTSTPILDGCTVVGTVLVFSDITKHKQAERLLIESERKFRILFGSIRDAVFVNHMLPDAPGRFIEVNDVACSLLGYTRKELLAMTPLDLDDPDTGRDIGPVVEKIMRGENVIFEQINVTKEGRRIPVEVSLTPTPLDGQIAVLALVRDITERKRAECTLRESEERFRATFEQAAVGIAHVSLDGAFLRLNQKFCEIAGYPRDELLKLTFQDITYPDDLAPDIDNVQRLLTGEQKTFKMEKRYIRKDRSLAWIKLTVSLLRSDAGLARYFISVIQDISTEKRAEEMVLASETQYRSLAELQAAILDTLPASVAILDHTGRMQEVNRTWKDFAAANGLRQENFAIGTNYLQICERASGADAEEAAPAAAGILAVLEGILPKFELEYPCHSPGEQRWFRMIAVPLVTAGQPSGAVLMHIDITERVRIERQIIESHERLRELSAHLQTVREEEKARIAREIHDDLGGTLTALKIDVYWLARALPMEMTPFLERAESMSHLLDAAVDATRRIITELRPSILDDLGLLPTLEWQCAQFQKRTGIECRVECGENHNNLDKERAITLFRIFQEALTNVVRHSGASRVEVTYSHDEQGARLCVRDNGCGLPAGFAVDASSYGLRGMAERANSLGGQFRTANADTGGLVVEVRLPTRATEGGGGEGRKT